MTQQFIVMITNLLTLKSFELIVPDTNSLAIMLGLLPEDLVVVEVRPLLNTKNFEEFLDSLRKGKVGGENGIFN